MEVFNDLPADRSGPKTVANRQDADAHGDFRWPRWRLPRLTRKVFVDLAIWMMGFGFVTGLVFPPMVVVLGMPADAAFKPQFMIACLVAGLLVGGANHTLARSVVGTRIREHAARMRTVEAAIDEAMGSGDWTSFDPRTACAEPDSDDELGDSTRAFNAMAATLADARERLTHQALHDGLTGLANRTLFRTNVEHALSRARRTGEAASVLFLDLDDFKSINDTLGHDAGDEALRSVRRGLDHTIRGHDVAARLGGDEFAVLMSPATGTDAARVAERLLNELSRPLDLAGSEVVIRASVGIASSISGEESTDEFLRNADLAMYTAKRHGKGHYEFFEPNMRIAAI